MSLFPFMSQRDSYWKQVYLIRMVVEIKYGNCNFCFTFQCSDTVGNTTVFHGRCSLFHTVGPDSLAELTCIFLVCDAYVANNT